MLQIGLFRPNLKDIRIRLFSITPSQELFAWFLEFPWFDFFTWLS